MPDTPLRYATVRITRLIDGWNLGRKPGEKEGETRLEKTEKRRRGRERRRTSGLISQQCDLFALYWHKEPTRYCATMLRRRALLPNRDLQLGRAPATRGDVWRTVMDIARSFASPFSSFPSTTPRRHLLIRR